MTDTSPQSQNPKIDELVSLMNVYDKTQKDVSNFSLMVFLILLSILAIFTFGLYHRVVNLDIEGIIKEVQKELPLKAPIIIPDFEIMAQRVTPVYMYQIHQKAKKVEPLFVEKADEELLLLNRYLEAKAIPQVITGMRDILQNQSQAIMEKNPQFKNKSNMRLVQNARSILSRAINNVFLNKLNTSITAVRGIDKKMKDLAQQTATISPKNLELELLAVTFRMLSRELTDQIQRIEKEAL